MDDLSFTSRRIDDALVFVSGAEVSGDRLGAFLDEHRAARGSAAEWSATELAAAFVSRFGEPVEVRRYAFASSPRGVAFHIRRRDDAWAERTAG